MILSFNHNCSALHFLDDVTQLPAPTYPTSSLEYHYFIFSSIRLRYMCDSVPKAVLFDIAKPIVHPIELEFLLLFSKIHFVRYSMTIWNHRVWAALLQLPVQLLN